MHTSIYAYLPSEPVAPNTPCVKDVVGVDHDDDDVDDDGDDDDDTAYLPQHAATISLVPTCQQDQNILVRPFRLPTGFNQYHHHQHS